MSDGADEQSKNAKKKTFDHGLDHKPKESFRDYSARKSKDFESAGMIQSFRKYLTCADPAMLLIHALVMFFVSLVLGFIATRMFSEGIVNQSGPLFVGTLSSLARATSIMLGAWSVGRLISDSIKEGKNHD
jgi:hypothetical protein